MMEFVKGHFTRNVWHYGAFLFFFALSAALLSKSYDGYIVRQADIEGYIGMSKEAYDAKVLFGDKPDWTNAMFGGMPTTQIGSEGSEFDVVTAIRRLMNRITGYSGITMFLLAMLGGYVLAISIGTTPWIALLCGVGVGLSSFEILYFSAGHLNKVNAIAFMPFVLAGVMIAYRKNALIGASLAAMATAFHVASDHPQMTYYLLILLICIGVSETWRIVVREGNWRKAVRIDLLLLAAGLVGVLPRFSHLAETKAYAEYTIRGANILSESMDDAPEPSGGLNRDYILEYSMADGEWLSVMCPDIKGGNSPLYWGEQLFSGGAFYFGAILVALFFMFLVAGRDRLKWPLLVVSLLAIVLSRREAGFLTDFFIDYVPFFNKFRDTKMMLIVLLMATVMGAGLALKELISDAQNDGDGKRRWLWMGSNGFLLLLFGSFYLFPELFFDFQSSIRKDLAVEQLGYQEALVRRLDIFRADVLRTMGLLALLAVVCSALLWKKLKAVPAVLTLLIVTTLDLFQVDNRYFNDDKINGAYRNWVKRVDYVFPLSPTPQMERLLALDFNRSPENEINAETLYDFYLNRLGDKVRLTRAEQDRLQKISQYGAMRFASPYRVLRWESPFNDSSVSYFFQNVGGYHAAKLRRYQDFIERVLTPERERLVQGIQSGQSQEAFAGLTALQMLNTRYILFGQSPEPIAVPNVPGFAWAATSVSIAQDHEDEMAQTSGLTRPTDAVVHREFESALGVSSSPASGRVELTEYQPDFLQYNVEMDSSGLVVFSEIWYPEGWTATIDGEEVETLRANYVLRALNVPAGKHTVTFAFEIAESKLFEALVNLLLVLFVAGAAWWGMKEKNAATEGA